MVYKQCKDCGLVKEESEFYGVQRECKQCTKERVSKNYRKNIHHYKEYEIKRNKLRSEQGYWKTKKYKDLKKYKARAVLNSKIQNNKINRKPCEVCGGTKTEGHHDDYNRPLEVRWLCAKHHRELHTK
jgi:hypothetical protein